MSRVLRASPAQNMKHSSRTLMDQLYERIRAAGYPQAAHVFFWMWKLRRPQRRHNVCDLLCLRPKEPVPLPHLPMIHNFVRRERSSWPRQVKRNLSMAVGRALLARPPPRYTVCNRVMQRTSLVSTLQVATATRLQVASKVDDE